MQLIYRFHYGGTKNIKVMTKTKFVRTSFVLIEHKNPSWLLRRQICRLIRDAIYSPQRWIFYPLFWFGLLKWWFIYHHIILYFRKTIQQSSNAVWLFNTIQSDCLRKVSDFLVHVFIISQSFSIVQNFQKFYSDLVKSRIDSFLT